MYSERAAILGVDVLEEQIDLAVAYLDLVVDFTLAQPGEQDLVAQVRREASKGTPSRSRGAKIGERHACLFRDALDRAVDLHVVDPDAGVARLLELRLVEDQPLEELPLEHVARRDLRSLPAQLALGGGRPPRSARRA